jgi:nitrogen-specific signal transduction histidine kinase
MKTVLLLVTDGRLRTRVLRVLDGYSVFEAQTETEALKILRVTDIDVVVRETGPARGLDVSVGRIRDIAPTAQVVAVGPHDEEAKRADFVVDPASGDHELEATMRHAADKRRTAREIAALRSQPAPPVRSPASLEAPFEAQALTRVLREFTRAFSGRFDLAQALDLFLDAVAELVRPTRLALLLPDQQSEVYRIRASRGLAPQLVESVRLSPGEGLPGWLAAQSRPARLEDLLGEPEIMRELQVLQGAMAVPLMAHGELVAILVVGQPIFGAAYSRRETETLFDLATHLAMVLRDIELRLQLQREKEFSERILAHMGSGVITIGRDERIGIVNRRAQEILSLPVAEVAGQDLRALPSPLGDMLYETLSSGRALVRSETQLAFRGLWLETSTYPVWGDEPSPLGAVLVFEDLTARKELAAQRRQAEQFQLLNRVVASIADELKNPLVSINAFIELKDERFDDPDFRIHFSSIVGRDVRRLVQVFDKLAGLVTEGELSFGTVDAHDVVDELAAEIELDGAGKPLSLDLGARDTTPQLVKADAPQLRRALSYLVWYLSHNSPAEGARVSIAVGREPTPGGTDEIRIQVASRTALVSPERLQQLFDPVQMVQQSLIDVGPAVSRRLIEALGGRLAFRQGRHELGFFVTLPAAP